MNRYIKEIIWLIIILLPTFFLYTQEDTINIDIYDIYYVMDRLTFIAVIFTLLGFLVYGIRSLTYKFRDNFINIVFLIFTVIVALLWIEIIIINDKLSSSGGWTLYPPLSAQPQKIEHEEYYFIAKEPVMLIIEAAIISIALYTTYRMGKNKKTS
ncbi:hypothetical protein FUA48_15620 [Flavobacterium alkalisoli]|uniref:Uncharacterized protein n=1 Tax=Flavobacterium alkalisoli TaxID=2602769 RepID=A0A5B9FUF4_9FLAO|nr:hypothetical protein [Flavobacterium alkalisoli]QEE50953.1 hypothetical protein FUA48_15620 [Flavobacterium alkalisoli]